jgi:hypothetical protein
MRGAARATVGLAIAALGAGCESGFGRVEREVVAWVGDEPIRRAELEAYLADNLLAVENEDPVREADAAVKSRLLDALIDQRLLLREAQRAQIDVTDVEVAVYAGEGTDGSGHVPLTPAAEVQARQRLMIEKLQEQVLVDLAPPTDADIAAWAESERERLLPRRPMQLRALQLPSVDVARAVRQDIRRARLTFDEAIVAHEPAPGQTLPTRVSLDSLPAEVHQAIEALEVGAVSEPVELHERVYLFQVVAWLEDPEALSAELQALARADLVKRRDEQALERLLEDLRKRTDVRIRAANLPFPYVSAS